MKDCRIYISIEQLKAYIESAEQKGCTKVGIPIRKKCNEQIKRGANND